MYETIKISTDGLAVKLIDKYQKDLFSIVHGNFRIHNKIKYFEISGTYSRIQRSGHLSYLFEVLVYELGYKVLSDRHHSSPGSKEFWQAQLRRNRFSIYRLNLETNFKRNARGFKEHEIWAEPTKNGLNILLKDFENFIEDGLEEIENSENIIDLDDSFEEVTEEFAIDNISKENLDIENGNPSAENIRLVAQKYVG